MCGLHSGILDEFRRRDSVMEQIRSVMAVPSARYLETLSAMAGAAYDKELRALGLNSSVMNSLAETARLQSVFQSTIGLEFSRQAAVSQSVFTDLERIADATRYVREAIGFSSMAQIASQAGVLSAMESMRGIEAALKGLPAWMKPLSTLQAVQPSWEIVSGLGAVGVGRPTLVQDIIGGLYAERAETVGFEAVVQMLQVADEAAEEEFAERVLQLLQKYSAAFITLLGQTTDWVQRQGLVNILTFLLTAYVAVENHRSRVDSDVQTQLAIEQASETHQEIADRKQELENVLSEFEDQQEKKDKHLRVLVRTAPLRMSPEADGKIMRQLYPDDLVRVVDIKEGWAHVEVFQYNSEQLINGWVSRRALRVR